MSDVVAIFASDIHIGPCPSARSAEPDWLAAMQRSFDELKKLQKSHGGVPVVLVGDIFDRYTVSAELVNFAIKMMPPQCYSIVGNHDLPNHNVGEIRRSSYWTLVLAGAVLDLRGTTGLLGTRVVVHPFPWGTKAVPCESIDRQYLDVAVVHKYIWKEGFGHIGADENLTVSKQRESLAGYDAAFFGDNHQGFLVGVPGEQQIMNCGTFFRRKQDEREYRPQVGLLHDDGVIEPYYLDVSQDKWIDPVIAKRPTEATDSKDFLKSIEELGSDALDFRDVVQRRLEILNADQEVRQLVLSAIG